jgi:hypothetical protein
MLFKKIIQLYTDYISLDYKKKLHAGELLGESVRRLLPFLSHVIYYENYNENKKYLVKLEDIYNKSLILEKEYHEKLVDPDNSDFMGGIWGF